MLTATNLTILFIIYLIGLDTEFSIVSQLLTKDKAKMQLSKMNVLWFGPTTYTIPIQDPSIRNKIQFVSEHFSLYIVALNPLLRLRNIAYQRTKFYLLPKIPQITNIIQVFFSAIILSFLIIKHRINLLVSQGVLLHGMISIIVKKILSLLGIEVKVLIDVHGEWEKTPFLYRGKKNSQLASNFIRNFGNRILNSCDAIRVVNKVLYKNIASITRKPIYVLPIYIDSEFFLNEPTTLHFNNDKKNLILYAGGLYFIKGVQYLIQAISEIVKQRNDIELVIAGEGPYKKELQGLTEKYSLKDSVQFFGQVSKRILRDLFYSSSFVVLPSLSEGLPRVLIEAMTCAKPVIASDVGGIRELVKDGENGFLVPPADLRALRSKINYLLAYPQITKMGRNGRNFVLKKFRGKNLLEGYVELYKKILSD